MNKRLMKRDHVTGKETWVHFNDDGMIVESKQNIDSLVSKNREEANEFRPGSLIGNTQAHRRKVADIPAGLYQELVQKFGQPKDNPTDWRKWLNDYDNRFFRTDTGHI